MNKLLPKIIIFSLLAILSSPVSVLAASSSSSPELLVSFSPDPLFSGSNFMPGDTITSSIDVTNLSQETKPVAIEAINISDSDNMASVLGFSISESSTTLFSGTLKDFFDSGETYLSDLSSGGSTTYDLDLVFQTSAGDTWQGKSLQNFDILVGFQGEGGGENGGGGGGSGGGGGGQPRGLTIFNEAEINVTETTATITWQTNYHSTTRLVYSSETEPHTFDYSSTPNYGYVHSTVEKDTPAGPSGVTFHQVFISGLTPGTTYYYRAISHASPDTVGGQQNFVTLASSEKEKDPGGEGDTGDGQVEGDSSQQQAPEQSPAPGGPGQVAGQQEEVGGEEEENPGVVEGDLDIHVGETYEMSGGDCGWCPVCPWWICPLIILLILIILWRLIKIYIYYLKKKKEKEEKDSQPPLDLE